MRPSRVRLLRQREQARNRRAVDIGVENADGPAFGLEREREIDRRRRFADAALAGGHRDDMAHARHGLGGARLRRGSGGRARRGPVRGERHHRLVDAGNALDRAPCRLAHRIHARGVARADIDREIDAAVAPREAGDRAGTGQGRHTVRARNPRQRRDYVIFLGQSLDPCSIPRAFRYGAD